MNYNLCYHDLCEINYYLKERMHLLKIRDQKYLNIGTPTHELNSLKKLQHFINWIEENHQSKLQINVENR